MSKKSLIIFLAVFVVFVFGFSIANAQGTLPAGYTDTVTVAPATSGYYVTSLGGLITAAIKWVAYISGIVLLVYIIWGGIEWMTAGGDKGKTEAGRTKITQSIIGFAILAAIFVGYAAVLDFLGLRSKVGIGNIGAGGSGGGTTNPGPGGTNTTTGGNTCSGNVTVGAQVNDGGSGGYCTSGAAMVRCMAVGTGTKPVSNVPYYDPCFCVNGAAAQKPGFTFGCQP